MSRDERAMNHDDRTRYAVFCEGEGWCPSHGQVEVFKESWRAAQRAAWWKMENPDSNYVVRPVIAADFISFETT